MTHSSALIFTAISIFIPTTKPQFRGPKTSRTYTLSVTTTPKAWPRNCELTRNTQYVRAALGLHPQLVAERAGELALWERHLPETRYVGEVGLDAGPRYYKSLDVQKQIFQTILQRCAEAGGKIITVHSVRSASAVLDMVEAYLPRNRGTVVLHWFTGSKSEARRATNLGCYFSVNLEMLRSDRGRALISDLQMDRMLTETDGPFTLTSMVVLPNRPMCILSLKRLHGCEACRSRMYREIYGPIFRRCCVKPARGLLVPLTGASRILKIHSRCFLKT